MQEADPHEAKSNGVASQHSETAELTPSSDFEAISWLALIGTVIGICLTVALPSFDPLAALFGQFP